MEVRTCGACGAALPPREPGKRGRPKLYCSPAHKERAKDRRTRADAQAYRTLKKMLEQSG
jgi:hypothetical protein